MMIFIMTMMMMMMMMLVMLIMWMMMMMRGPIRWVLGQWLFAQSSWQIDTPIDAPFCLQLAYAHVRLFRRPSQLMPALGSVYLLWTFQMPLWVPSVFFAQFATWLPQARCYCACGLANASWMSEQQQLLCASIAAAASG